MKTDPVFKTTFFPRSAMGAPHIRLVSDYGEYRLDPVPEDRIEYHVNALGKFIEANGKRPSEYTIHGGKLEGSYYFIIEGWN